VCVRRLLRQGRFGWADFFAPICEAIDGAHGGDFYLLANDFASYLDAQDRVDEAFKDKKRWARMSILSTAGSGKFSSDRTIAEYARDIWHIEPVKIPVHRHAEN
jgi:starch phosphorylase